MKQWVKRWGPLRMVPPSPSGGLGGSLGRMAAAFARARKGGAMLVTGILVLGLLISTGTMMSNYAWREAQWEEIKSALRASVSAVGGLLPRVADPDVEQQIKERVADFIRGLIPDIDIDADDVTIDHDPVTRITRITIGGDAVYEFEDIWPEDEDDSDPGLPETSVWVTLDAERFEVAVAVDVTSSMDNCIEPVAGACPPGSQSKIDALKGAVNEVAGLMDALSASDPGGLAVSVVPFASAVNVADTGPDEYGNHNTGTAGKRRYVRMLTGAEPESEEADGTSGHWVDTFHDYGTGTDMGRLASMDLPAAKLTPMWHMRREGIPVPVTAQVPSMGDWVVNDRDFWNGCVMARWGAYWEPLARPGWDPDWDPDPDAADFADYAAHWPARTNSPEWPGASATTKLDDAPLHLSDAPPDVDKPSTRFTAYSWPDARVSGTADARLQAVMVEALLGGARPLPSYWNRQIEALDLAATFNNWGFRDREGLPRYGRGGGDILCPHTPILPLTDDADQVRDTMAALDTVERYMLQGMTYPHLGVVWGLRALSPWWREVWEAIDSQRVARPLDAPCVAGAPEAGCVGLFEKFILVVSDGGSAAGEVAGGRVGNRPALRRDGRAPVLPDVGPGFTAYPASRWVGGIGGGVCGQMEHATFYYHFAMREKTPSDFGTPYYFHDIDRHGRFSGPIVDRLLEAFDGVLDPAVPATMAQLDQWEMVLDGLTPWELFRGHGFLDDGTHIVDRLVDPDKGFGFDGRPVHNDHACRYSTLFGPYGRLDDLVQIGGRPVPDVAPLARRPQPPGTRTVLDEVRAVPLKEEIAQERLDVWMREACHLAGKRGVGVQAIYIGEHDEVAETSLMEACIGEGEAVVDPDNPERWMQSMETCIDGKGGDAGKLKGILLLENCIDAAGGDAGEMEMFVTPTAAALQDAFDEIFSIRHRLRFLNPS